MLDDSLKSGNIAVCVKNADKKVLEQNDECLSICGNCVGEVCEKGCMEIYAEDATQQWKGWGSTVYRNSHIHGDYFDVTLLCSNENIITFLQPLRDKYEMALSYYRDKGLTRRETEVVSFTIRGISNADICTHLNNIYRKYRDMDEVPEFFPSNRVAG